MFGLSFSNDTMFCLGIMFILIGVLFFYMKNQIVHLENAQMEQAKLLQSIIASFSSSHPIQQGAGISTNSVVNGLGSGTIIESNLIDVSDGEENSVGDSDDENNSEDGDSDNDDSCDEGSDDEDSDNEDSDDEDVISVNALGSNADALGSNANALGSNANALGSNANALGANAVDAKSDIYEIKEKKRPTTPTLNDIDEDSIEEITSNNIKVISMDNINTNIEEIFISESSFSEDDDDEEDEDEDEDQEHLLDTNLAKPSLKTLKVGDLRKMVLEKNLHGEPSKLKKPELIELLEKH
jgi:hypothetical protein